MSPLVFPMSLIIISVTLPLLWFRLLTVYLLGKLLFYPLNNHILLTFKLSRTMHLYNKYNSCSQVVRLSSTEYYKTMRSDDKKKDSVYTSSWQWHWVLDSHWKLDKITIVSYFTKFKNADQHYRFSLVWKSFRHRLNCTTTWYKCIKCRHTYYKSIC